MIYVGLWLCGLPVVSIARCSEGLGRDEEVTSEVNSGMQWCTKSSVGLQVVWVTGEKVAVTVDRHSDSDFRLTSHIGYRHMLSSHIQRQ